jgi:UDP-glucuronate 4-epimerase
LKHLLVSGGAGFIGSSLIDAIQDQYKIFCIDNLNDYYTPQWKEENIASFHSNNTIEHHQIDIRNYEQLNKLFKQSKIDTIVHLAARAGVRPSIDQPLLYQDVNVAGTLNLLELARTHQVPHFIFASSSSVYGNQQKTPFSETDPVDQPISPYAATKKAGELMCYTYAHLYNIKMTCLRFFTVYGPKGRPDMAPYKFVKMILEGTPIPKYGDGSSLRDYTYIDDIVAGIIKTIETQFDYEVINLGNNQPLSLNEFIATIEQATGKKAKIEQLPKQPGDVDQTYADISKAKRLLGWQPKTDLQTGMEAFVQWYKSHRSTQNENL